MIKAIISSHTNANLKKVNNNENNKEVSFKRNDGMSQPSNDEFIKNVEQERDSIIKWANKRIDKLNAILKIAKNDDELPKTDKAKIAATAGDEILKNKAKELLSNPNVSVADKSRIKADLDYMEKTKNVETGHASGTATQNLNSSVDSAHNNISHKGNLDNDLDPYTPDHEPTNVPDGDGDSCDGSDSDSDSGCDESDCLSDTADCIS